MWNIPLVSGTVVIYTSRCVIEDSIIVCKRYATLKLSQVFCASMSGNLIHVLVRAFRTFDLLLILFFSLTLFQRLSSFWPGWLEISMSWIVYPFGVYSFCNILNTINLWKMTRNFLGKQKCHSLISYFFCTITQNFRRRIVTCKFTRSKSLESPNSINWTN